MANQEHLEILKQGVGVWNQWRSDNPQILRPSLEKADLRRQPLTNANLDETDLRESKLQGALLSEANLQRADLRAAELQGADLYWAKLTGANLRRANLRQAVFRQAKLINANLSHTDLTGTNFLSADLRNADLTEARLSETDFQDCLMGRTKLLNVDLGGAKCLDLVYHAGPSSIGFDTLLVSQSSIPTRFLRGIGLPEDLIDYLRNRLKSAIEFYSCFISYSSRDDEFAKRLHADLQAKGVRCWFAPEDLKIGAALRPSFDEAILIHDKLMVVLSESSVKSLWVEKEVETAFEKERRENRIVLFPIRLDDAVIETKQAWAADICRTRHIGDFRNWRNHDSYRMAFDRLLRDLKAEDKAESAAQK